MDANSGEPCSEMDISDLTHSLDYGDTFAQTASFLCRDKDEVRQKARQLGLVEHPGKRLIRSPCLTHTSSQHARHNEVCWPRGEVLWHRIRSARLGQLRQFGSR
jgi:hypothetical protein